MATKPVKLPVEVVSQLEQVKESLHLNSLGEAAKVLTDMSFSPVGMMALAFDMRNDVKELLEAIKELNDNLKVLRELNDNIKILQELSDTLKELAKWLPKDEG